MSLEDSSVALTYKIGGAQLAYGKYDYRERTTTGGVLPESQRLFVVKPVVDSDCYIRITLPESFVNYAISDEGRPRREGSYKVYTFWMRMSQEERLHFHVARYVFDRHGENFSYQILTP